MINFAVSKDKILKNKYYRIWVLSHESTFAGSLKNFASTNFFNHLFNQKQFSIFIFDGLHNSWVKDEVFNHK